MWQSYAVKRQTVASHCPGPPEAVKRAQRFPPLSESVLCGALVWARWALNGQKRRFSARADGEGQRKVNNTGDTEKKWVFHGAASRRRRGHSVYFVGGSP